MKEKQSPQKNNQNATQTSGQKKQLMIMSKTKYTNPLLGLDWMKKQVITLFTGKTGSHMNNIKKDPDVLLLKRKFQTLFNGNDTLNSIIVKI